METTAPIQSPEASILRKVDDAEELTKLDPNYVTALRLTAMLTLVPLMIGALIIEATFGEDFGLETGFIAGPVLLLGLFWIIRVPARRYAARGYQISEDRLRVVRGILWRSDTIVPFGRVQHIDVDQGPIERFFDIATLTVHTAGNHNASVHLPGLNHDLAKDMREEIRAHIKRESM